MSRTHNSSRQGGADGEPEFSKRDVTSMTTRIHGQKLDSRAIDWTPALAPSTRTGNSNLDQPRLPLPRTRR